MSPAFRRTSAAAWLRATTSSICAAFRLAFISMACGLIAGPYSTPQIDFNRIDQVDVVEGPRVGVGR